MLRRRWALVVLLCLLPAAGGAADSSVTPVEAGRALERATAFLRSIATQGGYVGIYSLDLGQRWGESLSDKARADQIWVQPPGTPTVGETFLQAFRVTGDRAYLAAAREVGRALVWGQTAAGGWPYKPTMPAGVATATAPSRLKGAGTLDDNTSQAAVTFLMHLDQVLDEPWLDQGVRQGVGFLLESQFPNGAWAQQYPLGHGYSDHYTFNDSAINRCIDTLLEAHRLYGTPGYLAAARRGGDFIIASRGKPPQTGWAQQYDRQLRPAWARAFEPPAYDSSVTGHNIRTLVDLYRYTGERRFLEAVPAAVGWLQRSKLGPRRWARLYEVGTNRPIYGDRDGKVHYTVEELSEERRTGYSWHGDYGTGAIEHYRAVASVGREAYERAHAPGPRTPEQRQRKAAELAPQVAAIIAAQDEQGRWVTDGRLHIRTFVENMRRLCEYLEAAGEG